MASEGSNGTQAVQVSIKNHSQIDKGMAIAGITVGLTAFSLCIFAFNWFTFWVSLIGGILLSTVACFLRKQNSNCQYCVFDDGNYYWFDLLSRSVGSNYCCF